MTSIKNNMSFKNKTLLIRTNDGDDDVLMEPLYFDSARGTYRAPTGSTTDGLSTPKWIRILPGYDSTGDDWLSGVLHDSSYRDQLEVFQDGIWQLAHLVQKECDDLILEAMTSQGVGWLRRSNIYRALRMFGKAAFDEDRANKKPTQ